MEKCDKNLLLSESECLQIVCNYLQCENQNGVQLNNYCVVDPPPKSLVGYLGEYFYLNINYSYKNKDFEKQFFIKSIPSNPKAAEFVENMGAFAKEVVIYRDIFQQLSKYSQSTWRPQHYLIRSDVIVMENLKLSGFKNIPITETFSNECVEAALKSMAEMHASSFIFEYRTNTNIVEICPSLTDNTPMEKTNSWYKTGLKSIKTIASIHPKFQTESYKAFINENFEQNFDILFELIKGRKYSMKVLCHCDVWSQNILFKFDKETLKPTKCVYVDFQLSRYHWPALDVWLMFYYSTRRSLRDENAEKWFKLYYDHLRSFLEKGKVPAEDILTWEEFHSSANEIRILPMTISGLDASIFNLPDEFAKDFREKNPELFQYYLEVDRTDLIFRFIEEDAVFKEMVFEIVEEVVDCFYKLSLK